MFEYDSIIVSYTRELTSVSMCYSEEDGVDTSLLGLCTVPTSSSLLLLLDVSIRDSVCWVWFSSVARSCATWDDGNKDNVWTPTASAGINRPPHLRPSRIYSECRAYETRNTLSGK